MKAAIYTIANGKIQRFVTANPDHIAMQCGDGEDYYLNCPDDATHITNNEPVVVAPPAEDPLKKIRQRRDLLLSRCDWTMLEDAVVDKTAWKKYRKDLRDFPATCDPVNPVWPVQP